MINRHSFTIKVREGGREGTCMKAKAYYSKWFVAIKTLSD
jgi:hypothetical protein